MITFDLDPSTRAALSRACQRLKLEIKLGQWLRVSGKALPALVVPVLTLCGCTLAPQSAPRNIPADAYQSRYGEPVDVVGQTTVALSFSGGGMRAAAFSFGVLKGLQDIGLDGNHSLLDQVSFITSVSGGAMTAAYYGLNGPSTLTTFPDAVLRSDGEASLRQSLFNPFNLARLLAGGLNGEHQLQNWLDDRLFHGATFEDLFRNGRPLVWINATNLERHVAFPFHQRVFDALCSNLAAFPVSEAVAASMAVPLVFPPVVLEKHPDHCTTALPDVTQAGIGASERPLLLQTLSQVLNDFRNDSEEPYIKLADGGLTDNYGLVSIQQARLLQGTPYGPLTRHDAIAVRSLLFVVVDAGTDTASSFNAKLSGPDGVTLALAAIDSAIDNNIRMSYDAFVPMMKAWQDDIIHYRCSLPTATIASIRQTAPEWRCDDVQFRVARVSFADFEPALSARLNRIPLGLHLTPEQAAMLVSAGENSVRKNPVVADFVRQLQPPPLVAR